MSTPEEIEAEAEEFIDELIASSPKPEPIEAPVPCFGCGKALEWIFKDSSEEDELPTNQSWGAVLFTSPGNFGSQAYDDGYRHLEINICDECLVAGAERVAQATPVRIIPPTPTLSRWAAPTIEQED